MWLQFCYSIQHVNFYATVGFIFVATFGDGSLLFQHCNASVHKLRQIKEWRTQFGSACKEPYPQTHPTPVVWTEKPVSAQTQLWSCSWIGTNPRWRLLQQHINAYSFVMTCSAITHTMHVMLGWHAFGPVVHKYTSWIYKMHFIVYTLFSLLFFELFSLLQLLRLFLFITTALIWS